MSETAPAPRLMLSTVGISLLLSHQTPEERKTAPTRLIELANEPTLAPDDQKFVDELVARATATLDSGDIPLIRRRSAELNGLYAIDDGTIVANGRDIHWLIATDTVLGRSCAQMVENHLKNNQCISMTYIPEGLTAADTAAFETGIKSLIHWCAERVPEHRDQGYAVIFNLVAAFKSLQGYLNTIGMFYADQILYLFEGKGAQPVYIPRLPIQVDLDIFKPHAAQLAMMAEGSAVVTVTDLQSLPGALYDYHEHDAVISKWGLLMWQQVRQELLGDELLDFPEIDYANTFYKDFRKTNAETRMRLQATLARVSTVLSENDNGVAKLKSDGGVQYDKYVNRKTRDRDPIGHFRASDNYRISCIAQNGRLRLRHCGPHDYVNNNP